MNEYCAQQQSLISILRLFTYIIILRAILSSSVTQTYYHGFRFVIFCGFPRGLEAKTETNGHVNTRGDMNADNGILIQYIKIHCKTTIEK